MWTFSPMLRRFNLYYAMSLLCSILLTSINYSFAQEASFQGHDRNLPIDIIADDLEVRQDQNIAIFRGAVEATQGQLVLKAETLTVYYKEHTGEGDPPIGRIDGAGDVYLSSMNESANGNWAIYDVERQIITLGGNVTLRQNDSILMGERLELDMESGVTRFGSGDENGEKHRVRGRFSLSGGDENN